MTVIHRFARSDRGQALAEFALTVPVLLFLVLGIIEFGRAWSQQQAITDAAREGARLAVVVDPTVTAATVVTRVKSALRRAAVDSTATVTLTGTFRSTGTPMTVSVSAPYRFVFLAPIVNLFGGAQASLITLSSAVTMRNE